MVTFRRERPAEAAAREALLDLAYGPVRFSKTSQRLREGRTPALALVAAQGRRLVGTLRLWQVSVPQTNPPRYSGQEGGALLLGPLAVHQDCRERGIGASLVQHALHEAARLGHGAVLLVGDAPYYGRFGFSNEKTGALSLPGPYEQHRLLGCELTPGALDGARGLIAGAREPRPNPVTLVARLARNDNTPAPRAA